MSANEKMPRQANKYVYIGIDYINWKNSLQSCDISDSELDKIAWAVTEPLDSIIDVTNLISDNNGVITFKEKQINTCPTCGNEVEIIGNTTKHFKTSR